MSLQHRLPDQVPAPRERQDAAGRQQAWATPQTRPFLTLHCPPFLLNQSPRHLQLLRRAQHRTRA